MRELEFFEEVEVLDSEENREDCIVGKLGVIFGKAYDEDAEAFFYSVSVGGEGESYYLSESDVKPTGKKFKREDFYSGESIRVSPRGEILGDGVQPE